jgi:hypothetical protein
MSFFHNLNKTLDGIAARPEAAPLNERDMSRAAKGYEKYGKEGMQALAKAGREGKSLDPVRNRYDKYDNKEVDEGFGDTMATAGAKLKGLKANITKNPADRQSAIDAHKGIMNKEVKKQQEFYGRDPMYPERGQRYANAQQSAAMHKIDLDGGMEEGLSDVVKKVGGMAKKAGSAVLNKVGHGSDVDMIRDLQRKMDMPQTGKKPEQKTDEAAKWRDAKYKDKLYTQEPPDYENDDYSMDDYYNGPKPDDYPGSKNLKGGGEFDHNDPLQKGQGIGRSGIKHNILDRGPRKGMPSRDQITSLKGSIKDAHGTHARPNLPEADAPMTAKQKSFAALAEPKNKITFADKIAGAKKEVDEMLGDVAAEAMKKALGGGMGRSAEMEEKEDNSPFTAHKRPRVERPKVGSIERGALHDIEHTATGRKVTRRVDPNTGHSVGTDDTPAAGDKRGKGRPKGTGKSIGAKGPSGTSKLMTKEGSDSGQAQEIYNELAELRAIAKKAQGGGQMPPGFASRLESSLWAAMTMIKNNQPGNAQVREEELDEKATSKKQQKFMGMVHAAQKGKKPASKEVAKTAKSMGKKDAEDFASTKHKGLPEKKTKKKEVEETTVAGSVATAPSTGKANGMFGKGVYEAKLAESFNAKMAQLNEGMNINASTDSEGHNSITVSATDEDAGKLAQILKLAGMGGGSDGYSEVCSSCGSRECGCNQVDEELANSADNTEYAGIDTMTKTLSGGLNGPKTTGQTTTPVVNRDPARGSVGPVAESQEARLWELYQRYSTK